MEITWFGHACFRLRERGVVIITDPFADSVGVSLPRLKADVVTISHHHPHHADLSALQGTYRVLDAPGEYEVRSMFITGMATYPPHQDIPRDAWLRWRNVIFIFEFDGLSVCHLGDLNYLPSPEQVQMLSGVNVLLLPVGGGRHSLSAVQAAEIVSMVEPNLVIPMHYRVGTLSAELEGIERFLKEMGTGHLEPLETLKVSAASLPQETQVVLLAPKASAS
ncbi:MAG: lactamase [Ardenticatenia bacterium]|jgi:L-ascorbate metabolism protein UlaG (beta-lactamase superfamily)|nr:MAG: lactamase [Ardenticatenia bacterium]